MKTFIFLWLAIITIPTVFSACAHYENLSKTKKIAVTILPVQEKISISDVHVWRVNDKLSVSGKIFNSGMANPAGHLDIAILLADGKIWKTQTLDVYDWYKVGAYRRRNYPVSFSTDFPELPPIGSNMQIAFHPAALSKALNCEDNQAI